MSARSAAVTKRYVLVHDLARQRALDAIREAPVGFEVLVKEPTRNTDQNSRLWATLSDISQQVEWYGKRLTPEDALNPFHTVPTGYRGVVTQFGAIKGIENEGLVVLPPWQRCPSSTCAPKRPASRTPRAAPATPSRCKCP
jgi:hypothetical protein